MFAKLIFAAVFLFAINCHAQQVKVAWGEESKKETEYREIVRGQGQDLIKLSFDRNGGGMFSRGTVTPILSRFDKSLNEKAVRSFESDEKEVVFNSLLSVRGNIYLFTSQYDKDSKSTNYFTQKININSLNPEGKIINLGSFDAIRRSSQSEVGFELSKDSSKILMFGTAPYAKKENEKYYIGVYDNSMKKEWEKTIVLPYLDKFVEVLEQLVTNDGEVGVIIKHYDQEVKKEAVKVDGAKVPAYKTKILLYSKDATAPKEFVLDVKDKFVNDVQLTNDINNNLVMFGMYRSKYDGYITGYFITSIDRATKAIAITKMEAFPEALVSQVKEDKQGSDKEKDPGFSGYFTLSEVVERGNGSTDYILQYKRVVFHPGTTTFINGRTTTSQAYYSYHYGDIIDVNTKPTGATGFTRVPKMQTSINTYMFSSFTALTKDDKLLLFYNDDPKNIEREIDRKPDGVEKFDNSAYAMAVIDDKGALTRSVVYSHKDMKLTTCVNECKKLGPDKIGMYAQKRGGLFSSAKDMIGVLEVK